MLTYFHPATDGKYLGQSCNYIIRWVFTCPKNPRNQDPSFFHHLRAELHETGLHIGIILEEETPPHLIAE